MTFKSDLGKETLYISPIRSPCLPMAALIPSTLTGCGLLWA